MTQTMASRAATADIDIRFAEADDAEQIAELYDRVYDGRFPIIDCVDPQRIRRIIGSGEHIWVIGLDKGRVVGSSVGTAERDNSAYEFGRAAVLPEYSGNGHFLKIFAYTGTAARERMDSDLVYGYARSERARMLYSFVADQIGNPIAWVGTDGGMHPNGDIREEHLIGLTFIRERNAIRVLPPRPFLDPESALARHITELAVVTTEGRYPAAIAAGHGAEFTHVSAHGRVSYSLFTHSRAAIVSAVQGGSPADVRRALWDVVDSANRPGHPARILHLTVHVLADKTDVIAELCAPSRDGTGRRFTVNGYLPAWHRDGDARYDCVVLTTRVDDLPRDLLGAEETAAEIYLSLPADLR
ncbi:hypothetical protein KHQ06_13595 [Nocardia tengchongensis]|uniref:N-acetyltransferase domain-containing protein n=1 Tax=Nocardia tengchongensis TaxID=2055889 RepID=A0ABX8CW87_9NOCA|nr:hypothetical protein [Nocardia tengchongensis]QVI23759.1 hypothetical protein KHQ06_13595 [Nocardia tengchongensis]